MDRPSLVILAAGMARRYGGCKPLAPIGPGGEAVIDLLAGDAVRAGFGQLVLVLGPQTGPAIRYHVEQCWPAAVPVAFAEQRVPLGTTHALLAARGDLPHGPFAVANADDVYGEAAMGALAAFLGTDDGHALIGYELAHTIVTDDPVTRGVCQVDAGGNLVAITERRQVTRVDGASFVSGDGTGPERLGGGEIVSVNLWGFAPSIWPVLTAAMEGSGLDEAAIEAEVAAGAAPPKAEVLLPEVVGDLIRSADAPRVRVIPTDAACVGVTHPQDLPTVREILSYQVASGLRPPTPWAGIA